MKKEYKIVIESIPKVVFAHTYSTESYYHPFKKRDNFIEITYFEKSDSILTKEDGEKVIIPSNSVYVSLYEKDFKIQTDYSHLHHTVAFIVNYREATKKDKDYICFTQPVLDKIVTSKALEYIKLCIKKILVQDRNDLELSGIALQLLSLFKKSRNESNKDNAKSDTIKYVEKAKEYIVDNFKTNFKIDDVANYVGISSGYLSNIFKENTGTTIIKYTNRIKLEFAINLVKKESATLKEVCSLCGINDPNYLSRMFKKYLNTSISAIREND